MRFRNLIVAVGAGLVLAGWSSHAVADWLSWLPSFGERGSARATLEQASQLIKSLPTATKGPGSPPALAAEVTAEGHWTFVNAAGERFTTASADELKRVLPVLAPEAAQPGVRLRLLVTEDTVFKHRQHFATLTLASDRRTDLMIAVDRETYPLLRRGERAAEQLYAEIRPSLLLELSDRRLFDEGVWQLAHPLKRTSIRVLALEPGGPAALPTAARQDPQSKQALTDVVAPTGLAAGLAALAGQTVILTARRDGDLLAFRPASGPELTLPFKPLLAAAEAADVNLVLLQSATPRQPGTRSWLWQRVAVNRLDDALGREHLADFLNALGTQQSRLLVSLSDLGSGRIQLRATPLKDDSSPRTGIGEALSDLVSDIAGRVVVSGVEASLRDRGRQREIDRRLIPGLPSVLPLAYFGLLLLGLLGHPIARGWWARIWPQEVRDGYGNALGYQAARAVRIAAYVGLFVPLVALASAPLVLLRGGIGSLVELLKRPFRQPDKRGA